MVHFKRENGPLLFELVPLLGPLLVLLLLSPFYEQR